jgi:lipid A 3-O-deacylase
MRSFSILTGGTAIAILFATAPGAAFAVDEARLGVADGGFHEAEAGPSIEAELLWGSPGYLRILGKPRPYLMFSGNVQGNTSFLAAGLDWRIRLTDKISLSPSFGLAVHDGVLKNKYAATDPRAAQYKDDHQLLGSRALFRESIALERTFGSRWTGAVYYEHLSNGHIFTSGYNEGLDAAGLRLGYKLEGK